MLSAWTAAAAFCCLQPGLSRGAGDGRQVLHLGSIRTGEFLQVSLTNRNSDARVRSIGSVEASCECVHVLSYPGELMPGEDGIINLAVYGEKPGSYRYEVTVEKAGGGIAQTNTYALDLSVVSTDGSKPPEQVTPHGVVMPPRVIKRRDQSIYVPAAELAESIDAGKRIAFADVRSEEEHGKARIPGSLNVPLYAVKARTFLKGEELVLVDNGWGDVAVERECRRLRENGFGPVHVLGGGICAWRRMGRSVAGTEPDNAGVSSITAGEWFVARLFDDWVVLDIAPDAGVRILPEAVALALRSGHEDEFAAKVREIMSAKNQSCRLAVVGDGSDGYGAAKRALAGIRETPVFYIEGGFEGVEAQSRLRNEAAGGGTRVTTGQVSGAGRPGAPVRKPCGGCP